MQHGAKCCLFVHQQQINVTQKTYKHDNVWEVFFQIPRRGSLLYIHYYFMPSARVSKFQSADINFISLILHTFQQSEGISATTLSQLSRYASSFRQMTSFCGQAPSYLTALLPCQPGEVNRVCGLLFC